jgi:AAA family ATP:ADP antiporter
MTLRSFTSNFSHLFDVRSGEASRIGLMVTFLFFLLAANNVIKTVRDSLFLSHFPITQLPYVYLLAAVFAGAVIGTYSRYTSKVSLSRVILGSHAFIISNVIVFWLLIAFYDFAWVLYAFYIWSAIVGLVVVAQFWTLANDLFTPREGKRLFGILTAGGTLGGMMGGFGASWVVNLLSGTNQLLWLIVALFGGAFAVAWLAIRERERGFARSGREEVPAPEIETRDASGIFGTLRSSGYLRTIAALIFVSVVVSTLIDYQFKAAAKEAYASKDALAAFFGSYYAWLSVVTLLAQLWLTGRLLMGLGLTASLLFLPLTLLAGSIGLLVWPGLFAATAIRLAEASLRTSVNHSGVEILYLPVPALIKKKVKVFLDVTVERLGDGTAAFIILFTLFLGGSEVSLLGYSSISLILIWVAAVFIVRGGYIEALRRNLAYREISLEDAQINYADKGTVEAVMKTLEEKDERAVLFGLDLAEKLDPKIVVARLPRALLHHASPAVRARAIKLFALRPDSTIRNEISLMLQDENEHVHAEAIGVACAIFKRDAIAIVHPYLESPNPQAKGRVLECLLRHGDTAVREAALDSFHEMLNNSGTDGEKGRVEAARLMGEVDDPEFPSHLSRLIREDPSSAVIRAAMAAAGKRKYSGAVRDIISRLACKATKASAREALIQYGEPAVEPLKDVLFDAELSRDIRINIPRTLSKIESQSAMGALLNGLKLDDRSIRYKVILALEEMRRRFPALNVEGEAIEQAIVSDAMLYFRRFAIFFALFGEREEPLHEEGVSLLRDALTDSMERVKERVMWLLSLLYPGQDVRRAWAGLRSGDPTKRANAIEFLDNLLKGNLKQYVFPVFSDASQAQRFRTSLGFLRVDAVDTESALRALLEQDDMWLIAATVWEIGIRRLTGFRDKILTFLNSENVVLRETADLAIHRMTV